MDHLWKELKRDVAANRQAASIDDLADRASQWVLNLTPAQARRKSGNGVQQILAPIFVPRLLAIYLAPMRKNSPTRCMPMSSASSVSAVTGFADFPLVEAARPGFWFTGLFAAFGWGAAAAVIHLLPDIDDFERTTLLAQIAGGIGALLLIVALGEAALRVAIPRKLRGTGPWLLLLSLALIAWELVTATWATGG